MAAVQCRVCGAISSPNTATQVGRTEKVRVTLLYVWHLCEKLLPPAT